MGRKRKQRVHVNIQQCPALQVIHGDGLMDIYLKMPNENCIGVVYDNMPMQTRLFKTLGKLHKMRHSDENTFAQFSEQELRRWTSAKRVNDIIFRWDARTGLPA